MIPSCDHTGVPLHFHSSTTSGSASLMRSRILLKVSPRQSPSSAILLSISSDADWPSVEPDFFMFSPQNFQYSIVGQPAPRWRGNLSSCHGSKSPWLQGRIVAKIASRQEK